MPARLIEQGCHRPIAVAPVSGRQLDDVGCQPFLIGPTARHLALGGAMQTDRTAGPAFRDAKALRTRSMRLRRREGLGNFPCSFAQDHLIQGQIRYRPAKPSIPLLQILQSLQLVSAHHAILTPPPIVRVLCHSNLTNGFRRTYSLPLQHLNLPQLHHNLFGLQTLAALSRSASKTGRIQPNRWTTSSRADQRGH